MKMGLYFVTTTKILKKMRYQLTKVLHKALEFIGINPHDYNTHSFRIGSATHLSMNGFTGEDIKTSIVHGSINLRGIPKAVLLHCGGNDIGDVPSGALFHQMKFTITILSRMLPGFSVIWSSILPRRSWRYSNNDHAKEITQIQILHFEVWGICC
jgi:hypothetical protein